jgi:hypothetical protein
MSLSKTSNFCSLSLLIADPVPGTRKITLTRRAVADHSLSIQKKSIVRRVSMVGNAIEKLAWRLIVMWWCWLPTFSWPIHLLSAFLSIKLYVFEMWYDMLIRFQKAYFRLLPR